MITDDDLLDRVASVLWAETAGSDDGEGSPETVTMSELSEQAGVNDGSSNRTTRRAVRALVEERNLPVVTTTHGAYIATEPAHIRDYLENLNQRIRGIRDRQLKAINSWEQSHPSRERLDLPDIFPEDADAAAAADADGDESSAEPADGSGSRAGSSGGSSPDSDTNPNTRLSEWVSADV